jgi:purine-binding chemotaxis protein CheW
MTGKVLTFYLNKNLLGMDITIIKEINRNIDHTPVPGAQPHIVGLFNMRGQIVTIFDLGSLMGLDENEDRKGSACIILKAPPSNPNYIGFFIDFPGDVVDLDAESCEPPPANVGTRESEFISHVAKLKNDLLMVIDPVRIFERLGRSS